jgi:hypothetical protein
MFGRIVAIAIGASFTALVAIACSDLKSAGSAAPPEGGHDAASTDVPKGGDASDAIPDAASDASAGDAGDPCAEPIADAGAVDREWATGPLPPADVTAANYIVRADVVCDRTTKLLWSRAVGPTKNWDDAKAQCDTLNLGGYTDWRLPTRIELLSIVDYGSSHPALESTAFPASLVQAVTDAGVPETAYWASSVDPGASLDRWAVSFDIGQAFTLYDVTAIAVRCVRGGAPANSDQGITYEATTNTALDPKTGLRWQRGEAFAYNVAWTDALQACQTLELDGFTGFRLPTIRELESLYDARGKDGPVWDQAAFTQPNASVGASELWSSNEVGSQVLILSFIPRSSMYPFDKTDITGVRCVKGP